MSDITASLMIKLKDNCNKEIFLVYDDEQNDKGTPSKICIVSEFMRLVDYLKELTPNIDSGTKILHGILTKASVLPKSLRGKTAFIIISSNYKTDLALVVESDAQSDKDLASTIETMLKYNRSSYTTPLKIENIYILYGYEISVTLSLDEEEVDEETITTCQKIVNDAKIIESLANI